MPLDSHAQTGATQTAPATARVRVRRYHERGRYDRATIDAILDAGLLCHLGFVHEGAPVVLPTLYWRDGDRVYWHGSNASRMLRAAEGAQVCLTVTHLDGLVLARSAFHHSANYRSVAVMGRAEVVADAAKRRAQLERLVESVFPGRWAGLRPVTAQELKATRILSLALDEASAKVRAGGPSEDDADLIWPAWAGVIPLAVRAGHCQPDEAARAAARPSPIHTRPSQEPGLPAPIDPDRD
jgi:nitroimidazol reductase NimA-like FMN-containing flavoprotein (pyridoxamine 5'-phosphate oxidase superfamily)